MGNIVIVSRHPAAIEFIACYLIDELCAEEYAIREGSVRLSGFNGETTIPVLASATLEDVKGKVVYGNLPLHLASAAEVVYAIEFTKDAPRGTEYGLVEMALAGAVLRPYVVRELDPGEPAGGKDFP